MLLATAHLYIPPLQTCHMPAMSAGTSQAWLQVEHHSRLVVQTWDPMACAPRRAVNALALDCDAHLSPFSHFGLLTLRILMS